MWATAVSSWNVCVYILDLKIMNRDLIWNIWIFLCAFHPLCNPTLSNQAEIGRRDDNKKRFILFFCPNHPPSPHHMSWSWKCLPCKCYHLISACDLLSYNLECICFKMEIIKQFKSYIWTSYICLNDTEVASIYIFTGPCFCLPQGVVIKNMLW